MIKWEKSIHQKKLFQEDLLSEEMKWRKEAYDFLLLRKALQENYFGKGAEKSN